MRGAAGIGTALGVAGRALAKTAVKPAAGRVIGANDRINVGVVGVGGRGRYVGSTFAQVGKQDNSCQVVAVCDVYQRRVTRNKEYHAKTYSAVDGYLDYREIINRKDIDAVIVATPDHWHAKIALAAMDAGKDVYLEKPMGLSVAEDQALRAAVRETGRVFQFGTQQRSSAFFRRACEIVRNGRIGKLRHVNVWCIGSVPGGSTAVVPVPEGFDYDFWLGPAPFKPHREDLCSADSARKTWWFNSDYALGFIAGWGVHPLDIAYWGDPGMMSAPLEVSGTGTIPSEGACDTATTWDVSYRFASGVTLNFRGLPISANVGEVTSTVRLWEEKYRRTCDHGTAFEGSEGWVHVDREHVASEPAELVKEDADAYSVKLPRSTYHAQDFLEAVRSRRPAIAPIEDAFQADLLCHLADIATRTGRRLTWDPREERFVDDDAANRFLACREMRPPWKL